VHSIHGEAVRRGRAGGRAPLLAAGCFAAGRFRPAICGRSPRASAWSAPPPRQPPIHAPTATQTPAGRAPPRHRRADILCGRQRPPPLPPDRGDVGHRREHARLSFWGGEGGCFLGGEGVCFGGCGIVWGERLVFAS
jgi:hypothetical protein